MAPNVPLTQNFGFVIHISTLKFFKLKVKGLDSPVNHRPHRIDTIVPSHAAVTSIATVTDAPTP